MKDSELARLAGAERKRLRSERSARDIARALELAREGLTASIIGERLGRSTSWVCLALRGLHSFRRPGYRLANGPPGVGQ